MCKLAQLFEILCGDAALGTPITQQAAHGTGCGLEFAYFSRQAPENIVT